MYLLCNKKKIHQYQINRMLNRKRLQLSKKKGKQAGDERGLALVSYTLKL